MVWDGSLPSTSFLVCPAGRGMAATARPSCPAQQCLRVLVQGPILPSGPFARCCPGVTLHSSWMVPAAWGAGVCLHVAPLFAASVPSVETQGLMVHFRVCLAGITRLARVLCPLAATPWRAALESCQPVRPTDSPFVCELPVLQQPWGPHECPQVFREQFTCVCVHLSHWEWGRPCV